MPYIVEVILSQEAWEHVLTEAAPLIGCRANNFDILMPAEQADILYTVMKIALARHHRWLEDRGIGAIISPIEAIERAFSFQFTYGPDALLFLQEFNGRLRTSGP